MIRADTGPGEVPRPRVGDHDAPVASMSVDDFFLAHANRLTWLAFYYGAASRADAEDAVSHVVEGMIRRWDQIRDPVRYANRAVASQIFKRFRLQRRHVPLDDLGANVEGGVDPALAEYEIDQWVQMLLGQLPPKQREVVECHLLAGETYEEMQERTGRTYDALRRSMSDALRSLREIVAKHESTANLEGFSWMREEAR